MVCRRRRVRLLDHYSVDGQQSYSLTHSLLATLPRSTYKDWISADIRQILIETHDLPRDLPRTHNSTKTQYGVFPRMRASDYFDAFKQNGFVLFSKEVNSGWGKGECVEWSYLKLQTEFLGDSIARTSMYT
jgi:hypothetical protein